MGLEKSLKNKIVEKKYHIRVCLFVCLFGSQAIHSYELPQGSRFLRARPFVLPHQGQSCSDLGEVHAGYVSVAGTDIIARTSVSGSFQFEYDFVHVHSD